MKIDPNDILWSSRGKDWGFRILQHPNFEYEWLDVYKEVFANSKDDERFYKRTQVKIGLTKKEECVGIRFLDPELRCDSAGRIIPHEFIVFGQSSLALKDHTDWVQLWPIISEKYAKLYPMNLSEVQEGLVSLEKGVNKSCKTLIGDGGGNGPLKNFSAHSRFFMFFLILIFLVICFCVRFFSNMLRLTLF